MADNNPSLNIALIPLGRETFDVAYAAEMTARVRDALLGAGFSLSEPVSMVSSQDQAKSCVESILKNAIDLVVLLQATFSDSTMAVHLAKSIDTPILLWALPEERTGVRLRLNSLCGVNLAGHALRRQGMPFEYVYAGPEDHGALRRIQILGRAGSVRQRLRQARIGRVGEHPEGFDSCRFDREALKSRLGVEVIRIGLEQVFQRARTQDPREIDRLLTELQLVINGLGDLDQAPTRMTLASYLALRGMAGQLKLDGMAIRCWPEFFTDLGCAACGAMSMLSGEMVPCSCEADVNGTITQLILQGLSGESAFGSDLVQIDKNEGTAVLWHCGLAPLSMADPAVKPQGTIHSNRRLPLLMEFPLKPGRVTVARLSEGSRGYRLVVGSGEMLRAPLSYSGTAGVLRFDRPVSEVLDTVMREGLEHHISLTYGDFAQELFALAEMFGLPVIHL